MCLLKFTNLRILKPPIPLAREKIAQCLTHSLPHIYTIRVPSIPTLMEPLTQPYQIQLKNVDAFGILKRNFQG